VVVVGSLPSLGCCVVFLADEEVFSHDHVRIFAQKEDCFSERLGYDSAERVVARRSLGLHCLVFALFVFLAFACDWAYIPLVGVEKPQNILAYSYSCL
jgi:hypothetical protein